MTIAERLHAYDKQLDHAQVINLDEAVLLDEFRAVLPLAVYEAGTQTMRVGLPRENYQVLVKEAIRRGLITEFARIEEQYRADIEWRIKAFGSQ